METIRQEFDQLVRTNQRVSLSKNKDIIEELKRRKSQAAKEFKGIKPDLSSDWFCKTCANKKYHHPETGYCFICDTDNWEWKPKLK